MEQVIWVSKWALTHGIFETKANVEEGWAAFQNPWTDKDSSAGPGDWHQDRWGALRQADTKLRDEMRLAHSRLNTLIGLKIQEYEMRDFHDPDKHPRPVKPEILQLKRDHARPGMEQQWGDADLPPKVKED